MTLLRHVYFIRPIGQLGPIKIGCTRTSYRRLQQLRTWSPLPLELVAELPGGKAVERQFHDRHAEFRSHGEWFNWSPTLERDMDLIAAGQFDASVLPAVRFTCWADEAEHHQIFGQQCPAKARFHA